MANRKSFTLLFVAAITSIGLYTGFAFAAAPGTWVGEAEFGKFEFKLGPGPVDAFYWQRISQADFYWTEWNCGPAPPSDYVGLRPYGGWVISDGAFSIRNDYAGKPREYLLILSGAFTSAKKAAGTWEIVRNGQKCTGNWKASEQDAVCTHSAIDEKIIPGKSAGKLSIGMSSSEVMELLGQPDRTIGFKKEKKSYKKSKLKFKEQPAFYLGFDEVLTFSNDGTLKNCSPVYKAYFKNDQLIYMALSTWDHDSSWTIENNVGFHSTEKQVEELFGKADHVIEDSKTIFAKTEFALTIDRSEWQYLKEGLSLSIIEGEVRNIRLFAPLTAEQQTEFLKMKHRK